jgi:hypothetical protein
LIKKVENFDYANGKLLKLENLLAKTRRNLKIGRIWAVQKRVKKCCLDSLTKKNLLERIEKKIKYLKTRKQGRNFS